MCAERGSDTRHDTNPSPSPRFRPASPPPRRAESGQENAPSADDARELQRLVALGVALVGCGCFIARYNMLGYFALGYIPFFGAQLALYAFAVRLVLRRALPTRAVLIALFAVALAARLVSIPHTPIASDDIYRYIWDGRVQAAGINPYQYPPVASDLWDFRDPEIYPGINRKLVRTIYPPVAQGLFRVVYAIVPDSIWWTKLAFSLIDVGTVAVLAWTLRRLAMRPELALLYAWHPLAILEVGHSGHVDAVAVFFFAAALAARLAFRPGAAGVALACAALIKFYALIAAPALVRVGRRDDFWASVRLGVAFALFVAVAYLPFLSVGADVLGYLPGYVMEEGIDSGGRYYLLRPFLWLADRLPGETPMAFARSPLGVLSLAGWYQLGIVATMATIALACLLRPPPSPQAVADRAITLFVTLFALATPSQPWYLLLLLACVPLATERVRLAGMIAVSCAGWGYLHWWIPGDPEWPLLVIYGGRVVALYLIASGAWAAWRRSRRGDVALAPPQPA